MNSLCCALQDHATALLLGLTFCVISPLIAPVACIYFLVSTVMGKYQLVYVYAQRFQSGGRVGRGSSSMPILAQRQCQMRPSHLW